MGFRLRRSETLEQATRRIAGEQLTSARAHLAACEGPDRAEHVHDARRALTRLRGLARLIRAGIGDQAYKALNAELRDAARALAGSRDADVAAVTLERLGEDRRLDVGDAVAALRRHATIAGAGVELPEIHHLAGMFEALEHEGNERAVVRSALTRELVKLRKGAAEAKRDPTPEAMHDWRKAARHLRSLLRLLEGANKPRLRELKSRVDDLCDALGVLHDCQVVREQLRAAGIEDEWIRGALREHERGLAMHAFSLWRHLRPGVRPRLAGRIARWREAKRKR